jgi:hypothetical protein
MFNEYISLPSIKNFNTYIKDKYNLIVRASGDNT